MTLSYEKRFDTLSKLLYTNDSNARDQKADVLAKLQEISTFSRAVIHDNPRSVFEKPTGEQASVSEIESTLNHRANEILQHAKDRLQTLFDKTVFSDWFQVIMDVISQNNFKKTVYKHCINNKHIDGVQYSLC